MTMKDLQVEAHEKYREREILARERDTRECTFTIACLPPSRSSLFFRAILIFHAPATQANLQAKKFDFGDLVRLFKSYPTN